MEENEVRYEAIECDDADYVIVAFGSSARICSATVEMARAEGSESRPAAPDHPLPFPQEVRSPNWRPAVSRASFPSELNAGQMVEDVRLAVNGKATRRALRASGRHDAQSPDEVLDGAQGKTD